MLSVFDPFRGMDYLSLLLRLVLAMLCGGMIGVERSIKNRTAGFRTHVLVCLVGTVAAVTGHYIYLGLRISSDLTRMSSQVISGLGFIGAGSILVTKNLSIKGLSTAAGLWTVGIIGIALGAGFYEGGILTTALVLFTQTVFSRLDKRIQVSPKYSMELRYDDKETLNEVMRLCDEEHVAIRNLRIESVSGGESTYRAVIQLQGSALTPSLLEQLRASSGAVSLTVQQ